MQIQNNVMIDSHAHLYLCKETSQKLLDDAQKEGVISVINVAIDLGSSRKVLAMYHRDPRAFPTIGVHPCEVQKDFPLKEFEALLDEHHKKWVAIGETGLDYYWQDGNKQEQMKAFEAQLDLAQRYNLPVIIHNRKADNDVAAMVAQFPKVKKVFHCFMSGPRFVETLMHPNHFFSFTGSITHQKKGKTIQAIKALPLEKMMVETDCPYLTPKSKQGLPNQPSFLSEILQRISEIKNINNEDCAKQIKANTVSFFHLENMSQ